MDEPTLHIEAGAHLCQFYQSQYEQRAVVRQFLGHGLRDGERCLYVTQHHASEDLLTGFQDYGINVREELDKGSLLVLSAKAWRGPGEFKSILQVRHAVSVIESLLSQAVSLRIVTDSDGAFDPPLREDELVHWEATFDLVLRSWQVPCICQYDLQASSPSAIWAALKTHSQLLLDGRLKSNPYFEASIILENESNLLPVEANEAVIAEMLANLRRDAIG